jgi:hypothetical protein
LHDTNIICATLTWPGQDEECPPYVFIAYTAEQFNQPDDIIHLHAWALAETREYANSIADPAKKPRGFWVAHLCAPEDRYMDDQGQEKVIQVNTEAGKKQRDNLKNQDVSVTPTTQDYILLNLTQTPHQIYSISDVVRGAEHVIVIAGHPERQLPRDPLLQLGERVWTFPEIVLSRGNTMTVATTKQNTQTLENELLRYRISKTMFAARAWADVLSARQLLEHYTNLHLSRLELMKIAVECLMKRGLYGKYPGDRSYALMSLLRIRPPIDVNDSSFQAFAR